MTMKFSITAIAIALLATANAQKASSSLPKLPANNRVCDYQSKGYFFSPLRTFGPDSRTYCESIGAELVSVDNTNFADLTQMVVKCLGPEEKAWVNSWDGNTFSDSPLAIWTGLQAGAGSINIYVENKALFGICSVRRKGLNRPEPHPIIASDASQSEDGASSASAHEQPSSTFAAPGFAVNPSVFASAEDAIFAENVDLNDAFGINSIAEDEIENSFAEDAVEDISAESQDIGNEVAEEEIDAKNVEEQEEEEEKEAVEKQEEEYENEIVEAAEPVSVEGNIQSIAPQAFNYNVDSE